MEAAWSPESDTPVNTQASAATQESGIAMATKAKTVACVTKVKRFNTKITRV